MSKLNDYQKKLLIEWNSKPEDYYNETFVDFVIKKAFEINQKNKELERCFKPNEEGSILSAVKKMALQIGILAEVLKETK